MTLQAPLIRKGEVDDVQRAPGRRMTERQFAAWCRPSTRAEWVNGEVIVMPPASYGHVRLNDWLDQVVGIFVQQRALGVTLSREFSVRLAKQRRRRLPDLLFVAENRKALIHKTYLDGAPDLIMEIVSPDSEARDWREKYHEYERAGVREYWVIDPMSNHAELYALVRGRYRRMEEKDTKLVSRVLPGFYLKPSWLWKDPLPNVLEVLRELGVQ